MIRNSVTFTIINTMQKIFLTSSASTVIKDLVTHFDKPITGLKVAFIDTASESERGDLAWLDADRDALIEQGFDVFDYSITGKTTTEVVQALQNIDVLFVAGGNTFYLLEQANKCNFKKVVTDLLNAGVTYIGSSAGSLLLCPNIDPIKFLDDPNKARDLQTYDALGLVDFIMLPHWGHERFKERQLKAVESTYIQNFKVILLTDRQYILVENGRYKILEVG